MGRGNGLLLWYEDAGNAVVKWVIILRTSRVKGKVNKIAADREKKLNPPDE